MQEKISAVISQMNIVQLLRNYQWFGICPAPAGTWEQKATERSEGVPQSGITPRRAPPEAQEKEHRKRRQGDSSLAKIPAAKLNPGMTKASERKQAQHSSHYFVKFYLDNENANMYNSSVFIL